MQKWLQNKDQIDLTDLLVILVFSSIPDVPDVPSLLFIHMPPYTTLYGHPLNTDTSLLRTVSFIPGEGKSLHFLSIQPA